MSGHRSTLSRLLYGCAGVAVGLGLSLGAIPALAAPLPIVVLNPAATRALPPITHSATGAESQVSLPTLMQDGSEAEAATSPKPALVTNSSSQSSGAGVGGAYTALSPTRLLDTRTVGQGPKLGSNSSRTIPVIGTFGPSGSTVTVPGDATAVTLNVTVTDTTAPSFLTVYPAGGSVPLPSNLNWTTGDTVANLVIVQIGSNGGVSFYNNQGGTDLVVDLEGYFAPEAMGSTAGSYVPLAPARICDTRSASLTGFANQCAGQTLLEGSTLVVNVSGEGGVPASGVVGVVANVTATDTNEPSFLTVYPGGRTLPNTSNLNWSAHQTIANRVMIAITGSGQIDVTNNQGSTDVVVDVDGYLTSGTGTPPSNEALFTPITPFRARDTRTSGPSLGAGATMTQTLAGLDGEIASNASAVALNVTAVDTTSPSFLTVYPGGAVPNASDVNWSTGDIVPNLTVATLSTTGSVSIFNDLGTTDVILDAFGYFVPESAQPLVITTTTLPAATEDVPYSAGLSAYGGTPPYSWTIDSGSLPAGLGVSSGGVISGTPSTLAAFSFSVEVTDSTSPTAETATAAFSGTVASAPSPVITTTSLPAGTVGVHYSTTLVAANGASPYSWAIASGSLPPGLVLSTGGVISGVPTTSTTFSFAVTVTDSASPTPQSSTASLSILVYLAASTVQYPLNWSGYVLGRGPYTFASGTFNVPSLYVGQTGTMMAEWVGIDGATNDDLIQAGIDEYPDPSNSSLFDITPWWEILPAAETPIAMTVLPGDSVTVTIGQHSGSTWAIELTDNTTGQSFLTDQTYTGPGSSVEWIVEAPDLGGAITTLASYTPDVTFSSLRLTGAQNVLYEDIMDQGGALVSTPSSLTSSGFTVAYGDVAPPPP